MHTLSDKSQSGWVRDALSGRDRRERMNKLEERMFVRGGLLVAASMGGYWGRIDRLGEETGALGHQRERLSS